MAQQTAVDWLIHNIVKDKSIKSISINDWIPLFHQAKDMEKDQRIKDYNTGFTDAQCNHINDAENLAADLEYLQSRIDNLDDLIKEKQDNISYLLIDGASDPEVKGWTIGPFGTPEKL